MKYPIERNRQIFFCFIFIKILRIFNIYSDSLPSGFSYSLPHIIINPEKSNISWLFVQISWEIYGKLIPEKSACWQGLLSLFTKSDSENFKTVWRATKQEAKGKRRNDKNVKRLQTRGIRGIIIHSTFCSLAEYLNTFWQFQPIYFAFWGFFAI